MRLLLLVLAISILVLALIELPEDRVVFLDVGQGDSILIQDGSAQVLIDGGEGMAVLEKLADEMPWFDRTIEVVINSHPERDHLEGLVHVSERYTIGLVLLPHVAQDSQLTEEWIRHLKNQEIPYRFAWRGQNMSVGGIHIRILGPFDNPIAHKVAQKNTNNASTLTRIDFNGASFLVTGDAERQVEHWLVQSTNSQLLNVDVLKAGHHGSKTSTAQELINAASPHVAVISVGADNTYGHPHESVMQRFHNIQSYRTDEDGSVRFIYDEGMWRISLNDKYSKD